MEGIFLQNAAVITGNSSLQTGNIPGSCTPGAAISLDGGEGLILSQSSLIYELFLIWTGSEVKLPELY